MPAIPSPAPSPGSTPVNVPSQPGLRPDFTWASPKHDIAKHEFVYGQKKLTLSVPILPGEDPNKILAVFTPERIETLGKAAKAAGLGMKASSINFQRNESGEITGFTRIKSGALMPSRAITFSDEYFSNKKSAIEKKFKADEKSKDKAELEKKKEAKLKQLEKLQNSYVLLNKAWKTTPTKTEKKPPAEKNAPGDSAKEKKDIDLDKVDDEVNLPDIEEK